MWFLSVTKLISRQESKNLLSAFHRGPKVNSKQTNTWQFNVNTPTKIIDFFFGLRNDFSQDKCQDPLIAFCNEITSKGTSLTVTLQKCLYCRQGLHQKLRSLSRTLQELPLEFRVFSRLCSSRKILISILPPQKGVETPNVRSLTGISREVR